MRKIYTECAGLDVHKKSGGGDRYRCWDRMVCGPRETQLWNDDRRSCWRFRIG